MYHGISFSLKKEVLVHATAWMELEDMMLRETSQPQRGCVSWSTQTHRDRKENGGCRETGRGNGKLVFNGGRVSVWEDEINSGDWLYNNVNILNTTEHIYTEKWLG